MRLNHEEYRQKLLGCWLGKNIGGTLGAPMEWERHLNDVSFYTQELGGEPLPNDDLDLQLLWLVALEEKGVDLDSHDMAEYWNLEVVANPAEYGVSKANLRVGLPPPLSGYFGNRDRDSCGCFIRSELWACICPGMPELAARYARQDGIIDHGNGEGIYGEIFFAALESAAFFISDLRDLLKIGLSYIPENCGVADAVKTAIASYDAGDTWQTGRDEILRNHRGEAHQIQKIALEDVEKGFADGKPCYDVPSNAAITVLGLLHGGEDFDRMICTTVNCGEDTDCTGATAGSIYGLIHGFDAIPERWVEPIGHGIRTVCLHPDFKNKLPENLEELTDRTEALAYQVDRTYNQNEAVVTDGATEMSDVTAETFLAPNEGGDLYEDLEGPVYEFDCFTVYLDYGNDPLVRSGEEKSITVKIYNTHSLQTHLTLDWYLPHGWHVSPSDSGEVLSIPTILGIKPLTLTFTFTPDHVRRTTNRCILAIEVNSRPGVLLVPLTLLNGDFGACNPID